MTHRVTLIPGDGIGPELAEATRRVLEATGIEFEWEYQEAGEAMIAEHGTPLPEAVLDRAARRILLMGSAEGGVEIEQVAAERPEAIVTVHAHPTLGLLDFQARRNRQSWSPPRSWGWTSRGSPSARSSLGRPPTS